MPSHSKTSLLLLLGSSTTTAAGAGGLGIAPPSLRHQNDLSSQQRNPQRQVLESDLLDSIPDILDGQDWNIGGDTNMDNALFPMPDWNTVDWKDFSVETLNWKELDWTSESWQEFMTTLEDSFEAVDVCPILEVAVGLGQAYGLAGDCTCVGSQGKPLTVQCGFDELCLDSTLCASADLNITVGGTSGIVNTSVCVDASDAGFGEVCFSYQMQQITDLDDAGDMFDLEHTCTASYNGNPCECDIEENLCLFLDCSAYLPGAKMDTCQQLAFDSTEDAISLVPKFPIFEAALNQSIAFETIDWANIDWVNVDWDNFGFELVDWTNADWPSLTLDAIFGDDMTAVDICPIITEQVLGLDEEIVGQCTCMGELSEGFNIQCSFEKQCTETTDNQDVIAISSLGSPLTEICGSIVLDYNVGDIGSVSGNLCVDFEQDIHPTTCIKYSIPIADQESLPTCTATYGGQPCICDIDDMLCVKVDCSEHEETAVIDQCQPLSVQESSDLPFLIPKFEIPSEEVMDVVIPEDGEQEDSGNTSPEESTPILGNDFLEGSTTISESNQLENKESSASKRQIVISLVGIASFAFAFFGI